MSALPGTRLGVFMIFTVTSLQISVTISHNDDGIWSSEHLDDIIPDPGKMTNCDSLVQAYTSTAYVKGSPPRTMPTDAIDGYTMNGSIEIGEFFVDDTINGQGSHYQYPYEDISQMKSSADAFLSGRKPQARLPQMDKWILSALKKHMPSSHRGGGDGEKNLDGRNTAIVFGSMSPWYEVLALAAGADTVHTVEYNNLTYSYPGLTQSTPRDLAIPVGGFSVALSISSFDHDGLGRYGDPINPDGDIEAMRLTRCLVKPGALKISGYYIYFISFLKIYNVFVDIETD